MVDWLVGWLVAAVGGDWLLLLLLLSAVVAVW